MAASVKLWITAAVIYSVLVYANSATATNKQIYDFMNTLPIKNKISKFLDAVKNSGKGVLFNTPRDTSKTAEIYANCDDNCLLVFAPTNEAMDRAFPNGVPSGSELISLVEHHYVKNLQSSGATHFLKGLTSDWGQVGEKTFQQSTSAPDVVAFGAIRRVNPARGGSIYWLRKQGGSIDDYHVNNAQFVPNDYDYDCQNGALHIVSEVIKPNGFKETFYKFAELSSNLASDTYNLWEVLSSQANTKSAITNTIKGSYLNPNAVNFLSTFFVVSTTATTGWNDVPTELMTKLKNPANGTRLFELMTSHLVPQQLVFTDWIKQHGAINIKVGDGQYANYKADARIYKDPDNKYYVECGGVTAAIHPTRRNIPVKNGVVHFIDRPLNFLYQDIKKILQEIAADFYAECQKSDTCRGMIESSNTNYTIFAPKDVTALRKVPAPQMDNYLKLHFIQGRVTRVDMGSNNNKIYKTVDSSGFIRFKVRSSNASFVEGRLPKQCYTRSRVVMETGRPATNGIVHLIDQPLGVAQKNIREFLTADGRFTNFLSTVTTTFTPNLASANTKYTVFPPTDNAVKVFKNTMSNKQNSGSTLLSKRAALIYGRSITTDIQVVLEEQTALQELVSVNTKYKEKLSLRPTIVNGVVTGAELSTSGGAKVFVNNTFGCFQCTNGVVYPITEVLAKIEVDLQLAASIKTSSAVTHNLILLGLCSLLTGLLFTV